MLIVSGYLEFSILIIYYFLIFKRGCYREWTITLMQISSIEYLHVNKKMSIPVNDFINKIGRHYFINYNDFL